MIDRLGHFKRTGELLQKQRQGCGEKKEGVGPHNRRPTALVYSEGIIWTRLWKSITRVLGNRDENPYVGKNLMASPFVRLGGKLLFAWCLIMLISEEGKNENLKIYDMLVQHLVHIYNGIIIAGRKTQLVS